MKLAHISFARTSWFIFAGLTLIVCSLGIASIIFYFLPISLDITQNSYFSQTRIWAHRGGDTAKYSPNSPEAVSDAFAKGFDGVELDIYFDRELDKIIVSHDRPYVKQDGNLVTLNAMSRPSSGWFWLDLKNLGELTGDDVKRFVKILAELGFVDRTLVESTALGKLIYMDIQGIQTIYWMSAGATRTPIYYIAVKTLLWLFGIDAVSISIPSLRYIQPHFAATSIFSFTENSAERLCHLTSQHAIAVVLTDLSKEQLLPQC